MAHEFLEPRDLRGRERTRRTAEVFFSVLVISESKHQESKKVSTKKVTHAMAARAATGDDHEYTKMSNVEENFVDEDGAEVVDKIEGAVDAPKPPPWVDLVILLDVTGSMGDHIKAARKTIEFIMKLFQNNDVHISIIFFRDHPQGGSTFGFITKVVELTSCKKTLLDALKNTHPLGGGDGPEAVEMALYELLQTKWRKGAMRLAIIIGDAPPHGLGEYSDHFPEGTLHVGGHDPVKLIYELSRKSIPVYSLVVPESLNAYPRMLAFYQRLSKLTNASCMPLHSPSEAAEMVTASTRNELSALELESFVARMRIDVLSEKPGLSDEEVAEEVSAKMATDKSVPVSVEIKEGLNLQSAFSNALNSFGSLDEMRNALDSITPNCAAETRSVARSVAVAMPSRPLRRAAPDCPTGRREASEVVRRRVEPSTREYKSIPAHGDDDDDDDDVDEDNEGGPGFASCDAPAPHSSPGGVMRDCGASCEDAPLKFRSCGASGSTKDGSYVIKGPATPSMITKVMGNIARKAATA